MDLGISGLRVIVTAGASGIGRAIAERFHEEGARVHVCDIVPKAIKELRRGRPEISAAVCDVADRGEVGAYFAAALDELGGLDCLVNNAGIAGPTGGVEKIDPADWDRTLEVNITGQFNCARLAVSHLASSPNASIINLSSSAGRLGFPMRAPYAASKWAVVGFTKSLSMELGDRNIRVNAILPGLVAGPRIDKVLADKAAARGISQDEMRARALSQASIKVLVEPGDIASMTAYLASPFARTISGQAISICGDLQALS